MKSSSTFRKARGAGFRALLGLIAVAALISLCSTARALDPHRAYTQYLRSRWTVNNGLPGGRINSITQTSDGYLWIATSKGLVRFNSFSFTPVGSSARLSAPISQALTVVPGADGSLWILDQDQNLQRLVHGRLEDMSPVTGEQHVAVASLSRSTDGSVLITTQAPRVFEYREGQSKPVTGSSDLGLPSPQTVVSTTDGRIWLATYEAGLFFWEKGHATALSDGLPDSKINCMLPVQNGGLWIGTDKGLVLWDGRKLSTKLSAQDLRGTRVLSLAKDRDANLWIGTSGGLFRLNSEGLAVMQDGQRRSAGRMVTAMFEDREGDLWVGDADGLERLCDGLFTTFVVNRKISAESSGPIYTDASARAWTASSNGGLYRIENGVVLPVFSGNIQRDVIYSIAGSGDELWLGRRDGGLSHLVYSATPSPGLHTIKTYTHAQGLAQNSVSSVFRSSQGTIWAGTLSGGVSRLENGRFTNYTSADGLGSNTVSSIQEGSDGAIWFATSDGLSRFAEGRFTTYRARDGLPSDEVITILADTSGVVWVGTPQGLAYISLGRVKPVLDPHPALHEPILALVQDTHGYLWVTSASHVLRVNAKAIQQGLLDEKAYREFSDEDGLRGTDGVRRDRSAVLDARGRVWLCTANGISLTNPDILEQDTALPTPHVESISTDGNEARIGSHIQLGPDPQRISIAYEAVNLGVPYRVRYRYKLQGFDHAWSDPTEAREVVYTNLRPGSYTLGLLASKGTDSWIGSEAVVSFTVLPAVWETWWFRTSCCLLAAGALWILYLHRLKLATRRIQERLDARLEERERIARELHDTLLQGFQGLMLRLQAVLKFLPSEDTPHQVLEQVLDRADQVLLDGRERVRDLRQSQMEGEDVAEAVGRYGEEFAQNGSTLFVMTVVGTPRPLDPAVFNEVVRIAREALFNCFQHAKASKVEAEVTYNKAGFSLRIADDGVGIDEMLVRKGRMGHWGLTGMRERARKVGGKVNIWTRPGKGTEIDLSIPAKFAFPAILRPRWMDRL